MGHQLHTLCYDGGKMHPEVMVHVVVVLDYTDH